MGNRVRSALYNLAAPASALPARGGQEARISTSEGAGKSGRR